MKRVWLLMFVAFALSLANGQQCAPVQQPPIGVVAGGCTQLTVPTGCVNPVWSLAPGSEGTIDQTGNFCAPTQEFVQSYAAGAQNLPNNADLNATHNQLPTHPESTQWVNRLINASAQLNSRSPKLGAGPRWFMSNYITQADQNTPCQKMHAVFFVVDQDLCWTFVMPPYVEMQNAWDLNPYGGTQSGTGPDRREQVSQHLANGLSINYEYYQLMPDSHNLVVTRGSQTTFAFSTNAIKQQPPSTLTMNINNALNNCSGMNGLNKQFMLVSQVPATDGYVSRITATYNFNSLNCQDSDFATAYLAGSASNVSAANVGTMGEFFNYSNQSHRSTSAGGLPLAASSIDPNQWYHNVKDHIVDPNCKDSHGNPTPTAGSHVIGMTILNNQISGDNLNSATTGNQVLGGHPKFPVSCIAGSPTRCNVNGNLGVNGLDLCDAPTPFLSVPVAPNTCQFRLRFNGATGGWAALNDDQNHDVSFLAIGSTTTFTIPVDSTNFTGGVWTSATVGPDWPAYGTTFVLDTTKFSIDTYCSSTDLGTMCPYEKALLYSAACYGVAPDDGTVGTPSIATLRVNSSAFAPKQLVDAAKDLATNVNLTSNLRVTNPSMGTPNSFLPLYTLGANNGTNQLLTTNFRRTTVLVNGANGVDINIVGTVVGIYPEKLPLIRPGHSFKPQITVTGSNTPSFSCAFETPVAGASITADGTVTAPASVMVNTPYREKCTSGNDPNAVGYADGNFIPTASDGSWYLWWGLSLTYVDTSLGINTWYGPPATITWAGNGEVYEDPDGALYAPRYGTYNQNPTGWANVPDGKLYGSGISARNDVTEYLACDVDADITLYGEAGLGVTQAGSGYNLEINGVVVEASIDPFVRAGNRQYSGYQKTYHAPCVNGVILFTARDLVDSTLFTYGYSPWSAMHVSWGGSSPTLTLGVSPSAVSIVQGGQGTAQLTTTIGGGFNSAVSLTSQMSPAPVGMSVTLNPTSVPAPGAGTSVVMVTTSNSTPVGSYPISFTAAGGGLTSQPALMTVNVSAQQQPTLSITATPVAVVVPQGSQGTSTVTTTIGGGFNSTVALAIVGLPAGASANFVPSSIPAPGNGSAVLTISVGATTPIGSYSLTITGSGEGLVQTTGLTLGVTQNITPVTIPSQTLPTGLVKQPYPPTQLVAQGGNGTYTWSTGSIPPAGMLLSKAGVLSGSPGAAGTFTVNVKACDKEATPQCSQTTPLQLQVSAYTPMVVTTTVVPIATVGFPYSAQLSQTGGIGPFTWSIASGTLPTGLNLDASAGTISGSNPSQVVNSTMQFQLKDSTGATVNSPMIVVPAMQPLLP